MNYWAKRLIDEQNKISDRTIAEAQAQLRKYYLNASKTIIKEFELLYEKVLRAIAEGKEITPAWLYTMDKYWELQAQLHTTLTTLGEKEDKLLSNKFEKEYKDIYNSIPLKSNKMFNTLNETAKSIVSRPWTPDGIHFSQRIWKNTEKLVETLNEELVNCVITGKKTTQLKKKLMERFNVSYNQADMLVRTEMAHIQTQASVDRYKDAGLTHYEFLADTDEKTCSVCKALDGKVFSFAEAQVGVNMPPIHPRDRCSIIPVVDYKEIQYKK